ncbi:class I SAM-dependent methyltransferase [Nocardioides terrisoli]|uniref:class I SAM-dependent methyltransferase n=1 Tax=Nocardioides terrisoli TaxID=3388267 RepID=UPI00287B937C|nr:class I SAM-dependent methyltransferase [Nocardioides marmorisolisilvae]
MAEQPQSGTPRVLPGARPSPNIWHSPATYELENRAFDRAGVLIRTLRELADWTGRDVVDIGCGTGFHLPLFAADARSVTGVEPHADLLAIARRRVRRYPHVDLLPGIADDLPLEPASVDVAHARWAYFFGPGSEPGLAELDRVLRPGGTALVIDNDPTRSTFGEWFGRGFPDVDPHAVERFWSAQGWSRERLDLAWTFDTRADLEDVVRIELPTAVAEQVLTSYDGTVVDYAVNLWWRRW